MFKNTVLTTASSRGHADKLVNTLKSLQPPIGQVSVLFLDSSGLADRREAPRKTTGHDDSTTEIRGVFASLPGIRHHFLPELDPFVASGTLSTALGNAGQGGGLADRLIAFGLPPIEARSYESDVRAGHFLIAVEPANLDADARLREVLSHLGARHVCVLTTETARAQVGHRNTLSTRLRTERRVSGDE